MNDKQQLPPNGYFYPNPWGYPPLPGYPPQPGMYHQHHGMAHAHMPPPGYPYPPQMPPMPQQAPQQAPQQPPQQMPHDDHHHSHHHNQQQQDAFFAHSQHMLEGVMGEQAGLFKDLMHKLGMDDKEFWKGAMIGAAAALVFSNENVRNQLLGMLGNAGSMLKTGGEKIKQGAASTASSVNDSVSMSSDVFRDTFAAGKAGFQQSVERHKAVRTEQKPEAPAQPSNDDSSVADPNE